MNREMTTTVAAAILAIATGGAARAGAPSTVLFSTLDPNLSLADSARCDSSTSCGGVSGDWTVYDSFTLATAATITSFSYYSNFDTTVYIPALPQYRTGSDADYVSTNWSIWSSNESGGPDASAPIVSSTTVGSNASDQGFTVTTVETSQYLAAGVYWIGFQNNLQDGSDPGYSDYLYSDYVTSGSELPTAYFGHNRPLYAHYAQAAFTIEGVSGGSIVVPEPSTWAMSLIGFAGLAWAARRRLRLRGVAAV